MWPAEVACSDDLKGTFGTLCSLVKSAGLADILDDPHGHFTVFAPTNDAFEELLQDQSIANALQDKSFLRDVLLYHVISGHVLFKRHLQCTQLYGASTELICISSLPCIESFSHEFFPSDPFTADPSMILLLYFQRWRMDVTPVMSVTMVVDSNVELEIPITTPRRSCMCPARVNVVHSMLNHVELGDLLIKYRCIMFALTFFFSPNRNLWFSLVLQSPQRCLRRERRDVSLA